MRARVFFDDNYFFGYFFGGHDFPHLADKLVTATRNRRDKFLVLLKAAESFSQGQNILRKGRFLDKSVRPDFIEKIFLFNHFSVIAQQQDERLKSLRRQRNRLILKRQTALADVQIKIVKF